MVSDVRKCYPGGKTKAFSLSYDDGVEQDARLVELLNRYGLKGTFNLNSQLMLEGFSWVHESGMVVRRLPWEQARELYQGHEIASHSLTHPYLHTLPESEVMRQLGEDKHQLEALFSRPVAGFALPFTDYNDTIARCALRGIRHSSGSLQSWKSPSVQNGLWRERLFLSFPNKRGC